MRRSIRPWLIAVGVVPFALALTGCFGGPALPGGGGGDAPVDDQAVEDMVEGSGDGIDFEAGQLPADFPVDAVPLVDGRVDTGMSISDGQAWMVTIVAADEATANSAPQLLEAAGFGNESVFAWENDEYVVVIVSTQQVDDGWAVSYQVQVQQ